MLRPAPSRLSPWIESLILNYGDQQESSGSGRLKAHVIGVGPLSLSQAQGSDSPSGLLFLSDGILQIPAILTAPAWEQLQEKEDRESITSLVNTTVCIQDYRLQFHMAPEQTKCRFFLSVGELATTAAGPAKDNTPCCTTLPSVRLMICKTWRALQGQEVPESQASQCGFDLTELLGEWQHDCMQAVLEGVKERLTASSRPPSPQPSTSAYTPMPTHADTSTATSWDADRVRFKRLKRFSVPIKCLLIPEEDALQLQTPQNVGSGTQSGVSAASKARETNSAQVCKSSEHTQPSVDEAQWRIAKPAVAESAASAPLSVEDSTLHEVMIAALIDSEIRPLSNPWDIFPPPCETSSSSNPSPEASPAPSPHSPTAAASKRDHTAIVTSTQLPENSKKSQQTSECSKGEHSFLPPYQKPPHSASCSAPSGSSASTSASPPEPLTRLSSFPASGAHGGKTAGQNVPASEQQSQISKGVDETVKRSCKKAKRKRSEPTLEELTVLLDEESQLSRSPPSWLFDSQAASGAKEVSGHQQGQTAGTVQRTTRTVHSDGRLFSYSYRVSGQNLHDFSQFKVAESWLHWATNCLLAPKQKHSPHDASAASTQTSSDRVDTLP